jgi:hypothetical protein
MSAPSRHDRAVAEIFNLLRAIENRDPNLAARLSAEHVQNARSVALRTLTAQSGGIAPNTAEGEVELEEYRSSVPALGIVAF